MERVVVVQPTLDEYLARVHALAKKYGRETWLDFFEPSQVEMDEDDRDEFSFIAMAVGDQLIQREFFTTGSSPGRDGEHDFSTEPGTNPGSVVLPGVRIDSSRLCGINR